MKTAAIIVAAAAALASAQAPPEGTNKVTCAKPNANYCYGGDVIIRCDANGVGTAGRCSDNVAGYPPLDGVAECWQSSKTAGDAACQKNCVVYAQPSFTLAAAQCTPSASVSATGSGTPTTLETSAVTSAPQTSAPEATGTTVVYTTTVVNGTVTLTVPCTTAVATSAATSVTGIVIPPPITPSIPASNSTAVIPPVTVVTPPSGTGGNTASNTPVGPTKTGSGPVPTGAAVANRATGALVALGLVAAYLF